MLEKRWATMPSCGGTKLWQHGNMFFSIVLLCFATYTPLRIDLRTAPRNIHQLSTDHGKNLISCSEWSKASEPFSPSSIDVPTSSTKLNPTKDLIVSRKELSSFRPKRTTKQYFAWHSWLRLYTPGSFSSWHSLANGLSSNCQWKKQGVH